MPMSMSTSDMTRIQRLIGSTKYAVNGQVQTKDLVSNTSSTRGDGSFVGKLKTVRETSKIIDFKASQIADYVLVSEHAGRFGRKLTKVVLCSANGTGSCTSVLNPKVITTKKKF